MLAPDWKPIVWTEEERRKGQAWGLKTIESFHTHGTPPLLGQAGYEELDEDLSEDGIASLMLPMRVGTPKVLPSWNDLQ